MGTVTPQPGWKRFSCAAAFLLAIGSGCGGGNNGPSAPGTGGTGGGAGSTVTQTCSEQPVFAARGFGENDVDVIRQIRVDDATGDLYFSILDQLFVIRSGAGMPEKIADYGDEFWLTPDAILIPWGSRMGDQVPVLLTTGRAGGTASVVVTTPASTSFNDIFEVADVVVVGDEVTWIARNLHTDHPEQLLAPFDKTYFVRKTSWRSPGPPQQLYQGTRDLQGIVVAGGKLYVSEEIGEVDSNDYQQKIIDFATGAVDPTNPFDKYRGEVVAGDDVSLIVSRDLDLDHPETAGVFRVAPDGSGEARLLQFPVFLRSAFDIASRDGTWVFTSKKDLVSPITVYSYSVTDGIRQIGCATGEDTTDHAIALGSSQTFLSIFRNGNSATILKYAQ